MILITEVSLANTVLIGNIVRKWEDYKSKHGNSDYKGPSPKIIESLTANSVAIGALVNPTMAVGTVALKVGPQLKVIFEPSVKNVPVKSTKTFDSIDDLLEWYHDFKLKPTGSFKVFLQNESRAIAHYSFGDKLRALNDDKFSRLFSNYSKGTSKETVTYILSHRYGGGRRAAEYNSLDAATKVLENSQNRYNEFVIREHLVWRERDPLTHQFINKSQDQIVGIWKNGKWFQKPFKGVTQQRVQHINWSPETEPLVGNPQ